MDIDEAINYILVRELTFVAISCGIKPTCPSLSIMLRCQIYTFLVISSSLILLLISIMYESIAVWKLVLVLIWSRNLNSKYCEVKSTQKFLILLEALVEPSDDIISTISDCCHQEVWGRCCAQKGG